MDVVVRGRVVEVDELPEWQNDLPWNWDNLRRTEARIRVETAWKGTVPPKIVVEGGDGGPDCSVRFTQGVDYLVFGQDRGAEVLYTDACAGTISADHVTEVAAVLAALGPGAPMADPNPASSVSAEAAGAPWPLLLASVAGLAALAGILARHRFRAPPQD